MQQEHTRPDLFQAVPGPGDQEQPIAGPPAYLKWLIIVLVVTGLSLAGWKVLGSRSIWLDDVDEGMAAAQASGKPMVLFFTADWCPPCRELKGGLLKDSGVQRYLTENYVPVKADVTDRSGPGAMSAQLTGVHAIPTMILYDSDGKELKRMTGGEIVEWLTSNGT